MRSYMAIEMAEMKTKSEQKIREESAAEIEALKVQVDQLKKEKKGLKGYFKAIVAQRVRLEERDTENKVFNEGALKMLKDTEMLEAEEEFSGLTIRENEH